MKTILVVDDSPVIRKAIRRIVEPLGFAVVEAGDGLDALGVLEGGSDPSAVLLDVEMPRMDGLAFLRALRGRSDLPQPRVIMCTTKNTMATISEALTSGANEYVMKPFDEMILSEKLQALGLVA